MSYAAIRRSGRKVAKMASLNARSKRLAVDVFVKRYSDDFSQGYFAWACVRRGGGRDKCGGEERGRTPTKATKKALANLARKLK